MARKTQFGSELSNIVRNPKIIIPIIGVMLIPLLYSALFLGAFWDPYAGLEKVPVAIVNNDEGAFLDNEEVSIGNQFVDKLKESDDFNWAFVSKEEALAGIESNDYYLMLEIPAQFSKQAVSLTTDEPQQAELIYTPNEGYNFLASQIGNTAVNELSSRLNQEITETYVTSIYDKLGEALEGITAASEGALQIANGAGDAYDGTSQLITGQETLGEGLVKLQDGTGQLNSGAKDLASGLTTLNTGSQSLVNGIAQVSEGGNTLNQGLNQLNTQYSSLHQGLVQSSEGTTSLKQGALQIQAALNQISASQPQMAESEAFKQLIAGTDALVQGLLAKENGESELVKGSEAVSGGLSKLTNGSATLNEGLAQVNDGATKLAAGANSADNGAQTLANGVDTLHNSTSQLIEGNTKLQNGQKDLLEGLNKLEDGATELATKLGAANGESLNLTLTAEMKAQFAKPVAVEKVPYDVVPNYGTGFAPYFISLGLYVGCMLLTIVYSMREPALLPKSGTSWFVGKTLTVLLISIIQAIILAIAIPLILNLNILHFGAYFLFMIITSITFMMLIQFLCVALDNVGRFIAIVLLILQLTSSAGTFPLELVPGWLQAINPFLPMTYSVVGFKQAISSENMGLYWDNVIVLIVYAVICSILSFLYMKFSYSRQNFESIDREN